MQRTTKTNVYRFVLHEASEERKKQNGCNVEATVPMLVELPDDTTSAESPPQKKQNSFCSDEIANIIVGKEREERKKKETINFKELEKNHPVIRASIDFLCDMHQVFDGGSVLLLDEFITKYAASEYETFAKYVNGLKNDFEAVKNAILNRHISNGPIEGVNNKIKLLRRIRYGRAGPELLNAVSVLSSIPKFTYSAYSVSVEG
jgi:transposase